jgi:hypothetical protein
VTLLQEQAGVTVGSDGTMTGTEPAINFQTGAGLISVITDTGTQINVQSSVDTAVVQTQPGEQSGGALLCASNGGWNTHYTCLMTPTMASYNTGMVLHWRPDVGGAGGPTTLNVDTLGAVALKSADGVSDPVASDIQSGHLYDIWYDGAAFRLLTPAATSAGSGGGIGTIDLPAGGTVSGVTTGVWDLGGANGVSAGTAYHGVPFSNSGAPALAATFRLPFDFDETKTVSYILSAANGDGVTGNLRFNLRIGCATGGASVYQEPAYGASRPTGTFALTANSITESGMVSGLDAAGGQCSAGKLARVVVTRDNSIAGNVNGTIAILDLTLGYTRK